MHLPRIKRLYRFMLRTFVPLFVMTFFICLFIVLMQFLWRYIDDLVGKGLEIKVIGELFFYAALTMVPMALPLAILLASLMTFGNLGERFELMAMKAAGISLIRVLKPLIALILAIAVGTFFFQNDILPIAQTKMYTLLFSMRQKSPELEIPEGVFYDQIPGYNLFVDKKNTETGALYDLMIYDVSHGNDLDRVRIIVADSGRMSITEDKTNLFLKLYTGEQFENLRDQSSSRSSDGVPYRRESFDLKEILIPFDNNFNRMDEAGMRNQYVGKNISELRHTIDSVEVRVDSIGRDFGLELQNKPFFNIRPEASYSDEGRLVSVAPRTFATVDSLVVPFDTLMARVEPGMKRSVVMQALNVAQRRKQDFEYRSYMLEDDNKTIRRHAIELMKKFTLSAACIIFFFIGAPLGAIIRKGGIGTPLVISVVLFIIYYIIDNSGYKLARDGRWEVWEGMWLSTAVLLPLGIFLTYKAMNDAALLNADSWLLKIRKLMGISEVRHVEMKEVSIEDVSTEEALSRIDAIDTLCHAWLDGQGRSQNYIKYYVKGFDRIKLQTLADSLEEMVDALSNSRSKLIVNMLGNYPILRNLWLYRPTRTKYTTAVAFILFPVSIPVWLVGRKLQRDLSDEIDKILKQNSALKAQIIEESNR